MKKTDADWLRLAIALSKKCTPIRTAFCVGAVIVDENGEKISTGYSRETEQNKHAEEIAIKKALNVHINLTGATIYSSLEPCGERLLGKKTCVQWIIETGIKQVVFAAYEPSKFVEGRGYELLKEASIESIYISIKQR